MSFSQASKHTAGPLLFPLEIKSYIKNCVSSQKLCHPTLKNKSMIKSNQKEINRAVKNGLICH